MADDVHTVLVESALDRVEVLDAVSVDASQVDARAVVAQARRAQSSDALVYGIIQEAVRAAVMHLPAAVRDSAKSVRAEMAAVKRADPATIKAVASQEIAARKVERIRKEHDG